MNKTTIPQQQGPSLENPDHPMALHSQNMNMIYKGSLKKALFFLPFEPEHTVAGRAGCSFCFL